MNRLQSLDAFRGFTIAAMLLVNNPGDWGAIYRPLAHAEWHGWTFTDWIFPFFVFISGVAMSLSLTRRAAQGADKTEMLLSSWRRAALIVLIGLALNFIPSFSFETLRWPGVLQRLGLCAMLAAPLALYASWRQQAGVALALLAGYTLLMLWVPVEGADGVLRTGSLLKGEDTGSALDRWLMSGHLWAQAKTWDPEGLLSTVPAVASQIAGLLAGRWLGVARSPAEKTVGFFLAGLASLWLGEVVAAWSMPINKALWTPAYVFAMAGWACLVFGAFHWLLDASPSTALRGRSLRLLKPCTVFGMNALFLFVLSGLVAKALGAIKLEGQSLKALLYAPIQGLGLAPVNASLLFALAFVAVHYLVALAFYRRGWFVKL